MHVTYLIFIILTLIVAVLLIGIVLVQKSKGGGLSSQFGGGNQVLGVRGTNTFLEKATWTLAALILVFSVCAAYAMPKATPADQTEIRTEASAAPKATPQANTFATQAEAAGEALQNNGGSPEGD